MTLLGEAFQASVQVLRNCHEAQYAAQALAAGAVEAEAFPMVETAGLLEKLVIAPLGELYFRLLAERIAYIYI